MKCLDIQNEQFGKLTAIQRISLWRCVCECGTICYVSASELKHGTAKSCGCYSRQRSSEMGGNKAFILKRSLSRKAAAANRGPRKSRTREWRIWYEMKYRCSSPKCGAYKDYGGRGIKVCDRWINSFDDWVADMGPRPSPGHSIHRINGDGDYEPSNCRWATAAEQASEGKRNLRPVVIDGKRYSTLKAACDEYGVNYITVCARVIAGVPDEIAVKTPAWKMPRSVGLVGHYNWNRS